MARTRGSFSSHVGYLWDARIVILRTPTYNWVTTCGSFRNHERVSLGCRQVQLAQNTMPLQQPHATFSGSPVCTFRAGHCSVRAKMRSCFRGIFLWRRFWHSAWAPAFLGLKCDAAFGGVSWDAVFGIPRGPTYRWVNTRPAAVATERHQLGVAFSTFRVGLRKVGPTREAG